MDRAEDGTDLNSWSGVLGGSGLRVRNPSAARELRFMTPSSGFDYLRLSYAVHRTTNGARWHFLEYSADGGQTWGAVDSPYRITTDYNTQTFDLRHLDATGDNEVLMFRIFFMGPEATNLSGNNRFDNIVLEGIQASDHLDQDELFVFPNPVTDGVVYFLSEHDITLYDTFGRRVLSARNVNHIRLPELASGIYFIVTVDGQYAKILVP